MNNINDEKAPTLYVLGAADPEMEEIERVLKSQGLAYCYALIDFHRVKSESAYRANKVSCEIPPGAKIVLVECAVQGLPPYHDIIDHHRHGDPGYSQPPEEYMKGSSLGQLLTSLGLTPTENQRVIAAADHCPTQAYKGLCPGVDVEKLKEWRTLSRAARRGVTPAEMDDAVFKAKSVLEQAEKVEFNNHKFPWVYTRNGEICEASARYDIPFMYTEPVDAKKRKFGIMGADPQTISLWMRECGLLNVYGDPVRGYAGGYVVTA